MTVDDDINLFSGKKPEPKKEEEEEEILVFEANFESFLLFTRLGTQWIRVHVGHEMVLTGLNYSSVESMLRVLKVKNKPEVFGKIQTMETKYLELTRG